MHKNPKKAIYINTVNIIGRLQLSDRNNELRADEIGKSTNGSLSTILSFHQWSKTEQLQCWILWDMKSSSKLTYI